MLQSPEDLWLYVSADASYSFCVLIYYYFLISGPWVCSKGIYYSTVLFRYTKQRRWCPLAKGAKQSPVMSSIHVKNFVEMAVRWVMCSHANLFWPAYLEWQQFAFSVQTNFDLRFHCILSTEYKRFEDAWGKHIDEFNLWGLIALTCQPAVFLTLTSKHPQKQPIWALWGEPNQM